MKVPIKVGFLELEELCYYDNWEKGVICDDLKKVIEVKPENINLEENDIKTIVNNYFDKIIEIMLNDEKYREVLKKKILEDTKR